MAKVKVRLIGILAEETGVKELEIEVKNLQELLNKLRNRISGADKIFEGSRPRSYISIMINGAMVDISSNNQYDNIVLNDHDLVELVPIAGGG